MYIFLWSRRRLYWGPSVWRQ